MRSSPPPTSSSSSHPLKSPHFFSGPTFADQQQRPPYERSGSSAASTSLLPINDSGAGMRKRGSSTNLNGFESGGVDADVTRPSLKRLTAAQATAIEDRGGSGKARRSFDELSRAASTGEQDREVVVHELVKTDTIASISLSYGITPQALRHSNRLWPSDSIHLRKSLNIPLDQCHLPSSAGIERISRDDDGSLIVWEREKESPRGGLRHVLYPGSSKASSASDLGGSNYDLLAGLENHRSSLDSFRDSKGKAPALLIDGEDFQDAVSGYLPSTNNPYSFSSAPPTPPSSSLRTSPLSETTLLPVFSPRMTPPAAPPEGTFSLDFHDLHLDSNSPNGTITPNTMNTLARRILTISKVPASSLSYFPPPCPAFASTTSSGRSSFSDDILHSTRQRDRTASSSGSLGGMTSITMEGTGLGTGAAKMKKKDGGAKLGLKLKTSSAFLGLAPGIVDSNLSPTSLGSAGSLTNSYSHSGTPEVKTKPHWSQRWDLSYFGEEGEGGGGEHEFAEAREWAGKKVSSAASMRSRNASGSSSKETV